MDKYRLFSKSVIGLNHIEDNRECEDCSISVFENDVYYLLVSDGCGSAKYAKRASTIIGELLKDCIINSFEEIYNNKYAINVINDTVIDSLNYEAQQLECSVTELAATYLFVAYKNGKVIACRSGDGGIILYFKDGSISAFEEEKHGTVNETHYYFSEFAEENMDYAVFSKELKGAFIYCDGVREAPLDSNYIQYVARLIALNGSSNREMVENLIENQFLETCRQASRDDCSIAIMSIEKELRVRRPFSRRYKNIIKTIKSHLSKTNNSSKGNSDNQ